MNDLIARVEQAMIDYRTDTVGWAIFCRMVVPELVAALTNLAALMSSREFGYSYEVERLEKALTAKDSEVAKLRRLLCEDDQDAD